MAHMWAWGPQSLDAGGVVLGVGPESAYSNLGHSAGRERAPLTG